MISLCGHKFIEMGATYALVSRLRMEPYSFSMMRYIDLVFQKGLVKNSVGAWRFYGFAGFIGSINKRKRSTISFLKTGVCNW